MNTNPLTKGILIENFAGIGTVTPEMVQKRAAELAVINGRAAADVTESDFEQAKRELTGGPELDAKEIALEAAPESERWDPLPGSTGHQVPKSIEDDEDDEGRSIAEQLVDEGVSEAEHDQMLQAARAAEKEDPTEKTER
jgi:hypothetical protein